MPLKSALSLAAGSSARPAKCAEHEAEPAASGTSGKPPRRPSAASATGGIRRNGDGHASLSSTVTLTSARYDSRTAAPTTRRRSPPRWRRLLTLARRLPECLRAAMGRSAAGIVSVKPGGLIASHQPRQHRDHGVALPGDDKRRAVPPCRADGHTPPPSTEDGLHRGPMHPD